MQGALIATPQGAIAGGAVAGAAGGATETFVTNGLSKLFGEKDTRKKVDIQCGIFLETH